MQNTYTSQGVSLYAVKGAYVNMFMVYVTLIYKLKIIDPPVYSVHSSTYLKIF